MQGRQGWGSDASPVWSARLQRLQETVRVAFLPVSVLLIVAATLSWVAYGAYEQTQESEYRLLEAHARNAEREIAGEVAKINRLLTQIALEMAETRPHQDKTFSAVLDRYHKEIPDLGMLLVTDAVGSILGATDRKLVGRDASREPYFSARFDAGPSPKMLMSRPAKGLDGATAAAFTLPVVSDDGQFRGIVVATIGPRFFPLILKAINPEDSASMTVIFDRDGDILFRREDPEKFFGYNIAQISKIFQEHLSLARRVTRHIGPSAQNGKTRLFLVREVGDTGLGLILSRQLDDVLMIWWRHVAIYAVMFVLTTVVVTTLAVVAARRKRQALASQNFSDQLIETANVMVVGLDASGRITIFNEAAERITGYSRDEITGHPWFELAVPSKAFPEVMEMFGKFRDGGNLPHTTEYPILSKAGEEHLISWQNSVLRLPRSAIFFGINVTERKQMEVDLLAARQRADESNAAKSKFLAAISHDVRQPLHAQALFLAVLARTELNAHQREVLDRATAASLSCGEMLNTLLDFSRVDTGVLRPQVQSFRLQPLLNKIEREFELQADAKNLAYRSRESDLVAQSDPMQVELILRNLVANAIRYTSHGGVLVACRRRGNVIVVEIWDTGVGIDAAHQKDIFREFHQLGNPERDRHKGLGLGLAIADGLSKALGHGLSLSSRPGKGTVFRLELPISHVVSVHATPVVLPAAAHLQDLKVLVIDDDDSVRSGMAYLLRTWGCACDTAASIDEALALAQLGAPEAIISDYRLREQRTGAEAIAALRTLLGKNTAALIISGDTALEPQREALSTGVPLLHKPVAPDQLHEFLVTVLHTRNADRMRLPELSEKIL